MVTKIISAVLFLTSSTFAAFTVEQATVYHNNMGTDTLILNGSLPTNPYSSNNGGMTGVTLNTSQYAALFKADATAVKNPGPGYSFYKTHGSTTLVVDRTFSITTGAAGRAAGQIILTDTADNSTTTYSFGYLTNSIVGDTSLTPGEYKIDWSVEAFTMNGVGGAGWAQINAVAPEPSIIALFAPLMLLRRK